MFLTKMQCPNYLQKHLVLYFQQLLTTFRNRIKVSDLYLKINVNKLL